MEITRRDLLKGMAAAGGLASLPACLSKTRAIEPTAVGNPLAGYPDRRWEKVYLDQYRYDSSFTYVCSPNDTHACRVRAFVRNGVVVRVEQNYDVQRYADLYGNRATPAWNPRMCLKGMTLPRRIYGPFRLRRPMVRKGWKEWVDAGCPSLSDDPSLRDRFRFTSRGTDSFVPMTWDAARLPRAASLAVSPCTRATAPPVTARRGTGRGRPPTSSTRSRGTSPRGSTSSGARPAERCRQTRISCGPCGGAFRAPPCPRGIGSRRRTCAPWRRA
jgi:nitrate reductase alpha subunit